VKIQGIVLHPSGEAQLHTLLEAPSHAVLLAGPLGSGKTHIGTALAEQLLNTAHPETHAYFRVVRPEKSSITIEQIRELIHFFRLKVPGSATIKRTAVIEDADAMGTEAQNALLKLLEEPPADSVLILTSSRPQSLLPTIRSRVRLLQLPSPDTAMLTEHFTSLGYDKPAVTAALLRTGTNVADAAHLLADGPGASNSSVDLAKKVLGGSSYDRLLLVDSLSKQKEAAAEFVDTLATIAMVSLEASARKGGATLERWQTVLHAAHTAQNALDRSGNTKLVLTELMLAM
jgi:hypothetical protein